ncbi:MAG TPA: hypothetical protein VIL32_16300, partial [Steroidobacteraceae bacterium]
AQPASGLIFYPLEFKARFGASWSRQGFTVASKVNYFDGVTDTNVTPNVERDSMTTLDLVIDLQIETGPMGAMGFTLAASNVLDERPPFMQPNLGQPYLARYDSTNYSALGRVISATVTKKFN